MADIQLPAADNPLNDLELSLVQGFEALPREPYDEDLREILVNLSGMEANDSRIISDNENTPVCVLIEKRFETYFPLQIEDKRLVILLGAVCDGLLVAGALYCEYLRCWMKKNNKTAITMGDFIKEVFPVKDGLPARTEIKPFYNRIMNCGHIDTQYWL